MSSISPNTVSSILEVDRAFYFNDVRSFVIIFRIVYVYSKDISVVYLGIMIPRFL
jgi:hypothetical protein